MRAIMKLDRFKEAVRSADSEPMILGGDFNSPSHLDWISDVLSNRSSCKKTALRKTVEIHRWIQMQNFCQVSKGEGCTMDF